jgi:hypothetical protein
LMMTPVSRAVSAMVAMGFEVEAEQGFAI